MPYTAPTRSEILARVMGAYRLETGVDPLQASIERGLVLALVGESKGQYGFLSYIFRQLWADTADAFYFWRWAGIFGIDQKVATAWTGTYQFEGANGTTIPDNTEVTRSDGKVYVTSGAGVIAAGVVTVALIADEAGTDSNNEDGQTLVITTPIVGVINAGTVQDTTHTGTDDETQSEGLVRLLQRLRTPPSGGGPGDYVRWALSVAGVTRAWEFANLEGENSVSVAFVRDNDGAGADIVPDADERAEVLAYLQSVAPITVDVRVITLSALTVDFEIADLEDDTPETRAAIEAQLTDLLYREGDPGESIPLTHVESAISAADGETDHTLNDPSGAIVIATNEIPIFGTLTVV